MGSAVSTSGGDTALSPKSMAFARQATSKMGFQNKLIEKQRAGSLGTYQQLLFRLSQPAADNFLQQSDTFLKEDLFSSPKHRDPQLCYRETMKIRFEDGHKVVARSICGTKGSYDAIIKLR